MEWFYAKDGKQEGPVDLATMQAKLQSGEILPTDLIWKEGMAEWTRADKVPEVAPGATAEPSGATIPPEGETGAVPVAAPAPVSGTPAGSSPPASGLAIASLVCGILGVVSCYVHALFALPAVICGHMALKRIKRAPDEIGGRGMALAGVIMGYVGLLLQIVMIAFVAIFMMKAVPEMQQQQETMLREMQQQQAEMMREAQEELRAQEGQNSGN